jgi:hypothetical protein
LGLLFGREGCRFALFSLYADNKIKHAATAKKTGIHFIGDNNWWMNGLDLNYLGGIYFCD